MIFVIFYDDFWVLDYRLNYNNISKYTNY